jgi:hypothetical protein
LFEHSSSPTQMGTTAAAVVVYSDAPLREREREQREG